MKGILTATAVIGALAVGGVPALALALTDDAGNGSPGEPGWMRHDDTPPPGWVKNHGGGTPFGWEMRAWAHCVATASAARPEGEKADRDQACGGKPDPHQGRPAHGRHAKRPAR